MAVREAFEDPVIRAKVRQYGQSLLRHNTGWQTDDGVLFTALDDAWLVLLREPDRQVNLAYIYRAVWFAVMNTLAGDVPKSDAMAHRVTLMTLPSEEKTTNDLLEACFSDGNPDGTEESAIGRVDLERAFATLPADCRLVGTLVEGLGLSIREAEEYLRTVGKPVSRMSLHRTNRRAVEHLRTYLKGYDHAETAKMGPA